MKVREYELIRHGKIQLDQRKSFDLSVEKGDWWGVCTGTGLTEWSAFHDAMAYLAEAAGDEDLDLSVFDTVDLPTDPCGEGELYVVSVRVR
jgi:hypothetical protein